MSEQLVPNIYDVLHSRLSSPWLQEVLRGVLSDGRDPREAARDARLLSAVLDARAEDWRSNEHACADGERQVAMVDLCLPLDDAPAVTLQSSVIAVDFPNNAWRSNANV